MTEATNLASKLRNIWNQDTELSNICIVIQIIKFYLLFQFFIFYFNSFFYLYLQFWYALSASWIAPYKQNSESNMQSQLSYSYDGCSVMSNCLQLHGL